MVWVVNGTGSPLNVILVNVPVGPFVGSIPCRFLALAPATILKYRVLPLHDRDWKDDVLRPSSQVSICRDETIGTPRL